MVININITDKRASVEGAPVIVCGNSEYSIKFTFDAEWGADTYKTARFVYVRGGRVLHEDRDFTGDTVQVPRLANIREVHVGVFEGERYTTTPAVIPCEPSILCGSGEPAAPSPETDARILELLNLAIAQQAQAEATAADNASAIVLSASGYGVTITDSASRILRGLKVYGKTTQDGTPAPSAPVPLVNVGGDGRALVSIEGEGSAGPQQLFTEVPNGLCSVIGPNGEEVADEIDYARGVLIRRTHVQIFKGTENFIPLGVAGAANAFFYQVYPAVKPATIDNEGFSVCSHFESKRITSATTDVGHQVRKISNGDQCRILFRPEGVADMDGATFSSWLKANPTTVIYALETPTETPLSAEELAAYKRMRTNYPTTVISADNDARLAVDYVADTKTYIDNKLAALVANS